MRLFGALLTLVLAITPAMADYVLIPPSPVAGPGIGCSTVPSPVYPCYVSNLHVSNANAAIGLSGNLAFSGTWTGTSAPSNAAFYWKGSVTGTCDNTGQLCGAIEIIVNNLGVTSAISTGGDQGSVFDLRGNAGGSGQNGPIAWSNEDMLFTATSNNGGNNYYYTTARIAARASATDGGTLGSERGHLFALNPLCQLQGTATDWWEDSCQENDLSIATGSSARFTRGMAIVLLSTNAVAASIENTGILISAQGGALSTFDLGINIGGYEGWLPIASTGTVLGCRPHAGSGNCRDFGNNSTIAHGVDFTGLTFSSDAFKSTGFSVDGSGNVVSRLVSTAGFTVATLPAAGTAGRRAFVTDQNAACPAVGGALTGGGAVKCPVFDNGTAWVSG
jgi:hypothetical protein